ncbi:PREDICTED: uncharacterized protein LOC106543136 [Thamnophis sirtalis]|uniref:Uncharacterized protein LOC106543136 n=1 Tax=Thamnophis sirtalis TaxID=35019 RepID=A0A6I9XKI8_9SAUR|nr:PREDICTED: uncharacterized protein LOC106543136 [Thamnophis sirtalis]
MSPKLKISTFPGLDGLFCLTCSQIYLKQQQDLQFLHFHLETSQEKHRAGSRDGSPGMVLADLESSGDRDSLGGEVGREIPTHFVHLPDCPLKKAGHSCPAQNRQQEQQAKHGHHGPFRHPRCLRREEGMLSTPRSSGEMGERSDTQLDNPRASRSRETVWTPELTPSPRHKHWLEANVCAATVGCLAPRFFDKASGDCRDAPADLGRIPPRPCAPPPHPGNHPACSACSAVRKANLYRSNQEWTEMLKPGENNSRGLWSGESPPKPPDGPELTRFRVLAKHQSLWGSIPIPILARYFSLRAH